MALRQVGLALALAIGILACEDVPDDGRRALPVTLFNDLATERFTLDFAVRHDEEGPIMQGVVFEALRVPGGTSVTAPDAVWTRPGDLLDLTLAGWGTLVLDVPEEAMGVTLTITFDPDLELDVMVPSWDRITEAP